jgi:Uma2 family endonuclease
MSAVTVMPREGDWTVADLDALPDDGLRYELVDGVLLVSAAPVPRHQRAVSELFYLLRQARTEDTDVFVGPLDFRPTGRRSLQPDLLVVRREDVGEKNLTALLLAVEVLSPGTRSVDLLLKHGLYAESGVASYWVIDPAEPSITVLELDGDGRYATTATATGQEEVTVQRPFPVSIVPAHLVAR